MSRTLLLMRNDLVPEVDDTALLEALTTTRVALSAGPDTLATHSGQSALVTAALTLARSGHEVWIAAPEAARLGAQPPLRGAALLAGLVDAGENLLPGRAFHLGMPDATDLAIVFGAAAVPPQAQSAIMLDAGSWSARLSTQPTRWSGDAWPLGGIAAGVLAAAEGFKMAMRRLAPHAHAREYFDELYAPAGETIFNLAPADTPQSVALASFDLISGGAIANAALFALARLPGVTGDGRVLDDDRSALSNLNRNALLRRGALDEYKVVDLAKMIDGVTLSPTPSRYEAGMPLGSTVLVGVDDIASRWAAQAAGPDWLGVGATEGYAVMVSSHAPDQPCVGCLHPVAAMPTGPIPTAAFVSLLSGLLLVARWQRTLGHEGPALRDQQQFLNALRPEGWAYSAMPLASNAACPVGCRASRVRHAA
ncbi:hypothetical protein EAH76_10795 [Sphingomonas glacialis]|uniref:THIF-type NAD/FAD binding fold domain-containing protein n=1 Tax=Sphingomonas glacialis TaxID=658225 RepID=A0A502G0I5_9SPHN|nr:hypothetical protein EAH76_10795 [Sphingomonas glacialis]